MNIQITQVKAVREHGHVNANALEPLPPLPAVDTCEQRGYELPNTTTTHVELLAPWPRIRIINKNGMNAIVATRDLHAFEPIAKFYGDVQSVPTMYTLQVDDVTHVTCSEGGPTYTNHSCEPNAFFSFEAITHTQPWPTLTALRDISADEEITFHYCHTEWAMAEPFHCLCGSRMCMGKISGFVYLKEEEKILFQNEISPFIQRKWNEIRGLPNKAEHVDTHNNAQQQQTNNQLP